MKVLQIQRTIVIDLYWFILLTIYRALAFITFAWDHLKVHWSKLLSLTKTKNLINENNKIIYCIYLIKVRIYKWNEDTEVDWDELSPPAKIRTLHCLKRCLSVSLFLKLTNSLNYTQRHVCVFSPRIYFTTSGSHYYFHRLHVFNWVFTLSTSKVVWMHVVELC